MNTTTAPAIDLYSEYREFAPPDRLTDRLVCLWTQRIIGKEGLHRHTVFADGCVDLVWIGDAPPIVAGPATRKQLVLLPAGVTLVGVRFKPGWAPSFLNLPASELLNQDVPLSEFWGSTSSAVTEQILNRQTLPARLNELIGLLSDRLAQAPAPDPFILPALQWLIRHPGGKVGQLASLLGVSERHLNRRISAAVGYGPKLFQRIMRFQRLLELTAGTEPYDLAELAAAPAYADQPHLCREVRSFTGYAPQQSLGGAGSTLALSDLFNTPCD